MALLRTHASVLQGGQLVEKASDAKVCACDYCLIDIYIYIYIYSESNVNLNHFHIDINECAGDKCHGGNECINGENQFECKCGQGWQGGGVNASCEGVAGA